MEQFIEALEIVWGLTVILWIFFGWTLAAWWTDGSIVSGKNTSHYDNQPLWKTVIVLVLSGPLAWLMTIAVGVVSGIEKLIKPVLKKFLEI